MDDTVYQIKQWNGVFEDHNTRRYQKLTYVGVPVDRQSETFSLLMESKEGLLAYGLFTGPLLRIAASCPLRGVLLDERGPYTAARVARRFNMPKRAVEAAWDMLVDPLVGWLEDAQPDAIATARQRALERARGTAQPRASDGASTSAYQTNQTNTPNQPTNQPEPSVGRVGVLEAPEGGANGSPVHARAVELLKGYGVNPKVANELAGLGAKPTRIKAIWEGTNRPGTTSRAGAIVAQLRQELDRA